MTINQFYRRWSDYVPPSERDKMILDLRKLEQDIAEEYFKKGIENIKCLSSTGSQNTKVS